jgi:adenosylcobinamide-GDP ribazoletransferase
MEAARTGAGASALLQMPLLALEFLTILRLRRPQIVADDALAKSQALFPAVGLLLGGMLAASDWLLLDTLGPALTGWLLAALLLLLTGGLHADGLADSADGLFGGHTAERRLAIMRDSATGAFGALALVVVIGVKATALGQISDGDGALALIVVPALSRWACVAAIGAFPYARPSGLGAAFHANALPWAMPLAGAICLLACVAAFGIAGAGAWALAAAAGVGLGTYISPRIGGLTGDSYGAIIEVTETALLVAAVAWL